MAHSSLRLVMLKTSKTLFQLRTNLVAVRLVNQVLLSSSLRLLGELVIWRNCSLVSNLGPVLWWSMFLFVLDKFWCGCLVFSLANDPCSKSASSKLYSLFNWGGKRKYYEYMCGCVCRFCVCMSVFLLQVCMSIFVFALFLYFYLILFLGLTMA